MKTTPSIDRLLFIAAESFSTPEEQRIFLNFACQGDETRRDRIEALLAARSAADAFFEPPAAANRTAHDPDASDAHIGPYRLVGRLGAGSGGVVHLAEQSEPVRRKVALKILRLEMDGEEFSARFLAERETLARMDHPHIARVIDAGLTGSGRPYFAMELVDGEIITTFCDRKRLPIKERLRLFIQVCHAIQHAHQKGVIHRDIKPNNILVTESDGLAIPKIIDFGIAKATPDPAADDTAATRHGQVLGTPYYMSPEQAQASRDIDTRSDIYSLGILLHELLAGSPPSHTETLSERGTSEFRTLLLRMPPTAPSSRLAEVSSEELSHVARHRATDPARLRSQIAGDLDWIVLKATDRDRDRRYSTASGLAMDVQRHLDEFPVLARPPSRRYLLAKLVRRNRIVFAATAIATACLLFALGTSTWLLHREREALAEAKRARAIEVHLLKKAQAAQHLTQAAVFARYNRLQEADALLVDFPPDLIPLSLEAADTLKSLADWNLTQAKWQTAAQRFSSLVPVITSVDLTDTDRTSQILLPAATAIKEWGQPEQYQEMRRLALRRFAETSHDGVAAQVAKAVLLEPADAETLRQLEPIAKLLESAVSSDAAGTSPYLLAWRRFSMGLLAWRQNRLEAADEWIRLSFEIPGHPAQLTASNHVVLAMVRIRQNRREEARELLDGVQASIDAWQAEPFRLGTSTDFWFDWVNARILLKEAQAMLTP